MTQPIAQTRGNRPPRVRAARRKSSSPKTGKRRCGKSCRKRIASRHRLIVRGAVFESIVPDAKTMTDEEAAALLRLALTSGPAHEFLKKRAEGGNAG